MFSNTVYIWEHFDIYIKVLKIISVVKLQQQIIKRGNNMTCFRLRRKSYTFSSFYMLFVRKNNIFTLVCIIDLKSIIF